MKKAVVFAVLLAVALLRAQVNEDEHQRPPKNQKGQLTTEGCVSRLSGYYILMQLDASNSYVLEANRKIDFGHYLGQQVEVTGNERATLGTSSSRRGAPALTIMVTRSIPFQSDAPTERRVRSCSFADAENGWVTAVFLEDTPSGLALKIPSALLDEFVALRNGLDVRLAIYS